MNDQGRISIRNFVKITKPTWARDTLLAKFDVKIGGIELLDCSLIEAADGHQFVLPPGRPGNDGRRPVFIVELDLRDRLLRLAQLKLADEFETGGGRAPSAENDALAMAGF